MFNPFFNGTAEAESACFSHAFPSTAHCAALYAKLFDVPMPSVREDVRMLAKSLTQIESSLTRKQFAAYCPLWALGHGDLNAANILVDAMDAVWMIDFATSKDMPLFNDLAKLEVALLFEYTILPVTCDMLLSFAGGPDATEEEWRAFNVGDWFSVHTDILVALLRELQRRFRADAAKTEKLLMQMGGGGGELVGEAGEPFSVHQRKSLNIGEQQQRDLFPGHQHHPQPVNLDFSPTLVLHERDLDSLITEAVSSVYSDRQSNKHRQSVRQLRARLSCDGSFVRRCFEKFCAGIAALVRGTQFQKTMEEITTHLSSSNAAAHLASSNSQDNLQPMLSSSTEDPGASSTSSPRSLRGAAFARSASSLREVIHYSTDSVQFTLRQIARLRKLSSEDWKYTLKRLSQQAAPLAELPGSSVVGTTVSGTVASSAQAGQVEAGEAAVDTTSPAPAAVAGHQTEVDDPSSQLQDDAILRGSDSFASTLPSPSGSFVNPLSSKSLAAMRAAKKATKRGSVLNSLGNMRRARPSVVQWMHAQEATTGQLSALRGSQSFSPASGMKRVTLLLKSNTFHVDDDALGTEKPKDSTDERLFSHKEEEEASEEREYKQEQAEGLSVDNPDSAGAQELAATGNENASLHLAKKGLSAGLSMEQHFSASTATPKQGLCSKSPSTSATATPEGGQILRQVDGLSLQMYLPLLREAYRVLGYRDIPPWSKTVCAFYISSLREQVQRAMDAAVAEQEPKPSGLLHEIYSRTSRKLQYQVLGAMCAANHLENLAFFENPSVLHMAREHMFDLSHNNLYFMPFHTLVGTSGGQGNRNEGGASQSVEQPESGIRTTVSDGCAMSSRLPVTKEGNFATSAGSYVGAPCRQCGSRKSSCC
ncbi:unnamed protein product [Amoebophrya sp. A25]|nr:unnamed protein product [Amoebophrya sp. A25]|eukprot:GSA25T00018168001.1